MPKFDIVNEKNKKVLVDPIKNFSDDDTENDEFQTGCTTSGLVLNDKNQPEIEINHFFNELPIRILNSHEFPFFYAEDICKVLNIRNTRKSCSNFTEEEIVSQELRQKYNIITYKIRRGNRIVDNRKILLTEFGVYRILMNSRNQIATQFRTFVYKILYQLRISGEYKIKKDIEQLNITNELLRKDIEELESKMSQFKNLCDELILVEYPNNPYEIEPTNVPTNLLKKHAKKKINNVKNRIDDPVPHAYRLAHELGLPSPCIEAPMDISMEQLRQIHNENIIIAHDFINKYAPKKSYMVTTELNPEMITDGNIIHRVYVKNKISALDLLRKKLIDYKSDRASSRIHWYTCERQKIIAAMDAII